MKKKYVQPKMKTVKVAQRTPLLGSSLEHAGFNETPGETGNYR